MKKWYEEEYEWEIEVMGFLAETRQSTIAATARKLATGTPVLMAAR